MIENGQYYLSRVSKNPVFSRKIEEQKQDESRVSSGGLNSKRLCLQQIYGEGKYKDCNDLPIGESAIAFSSALNKPDANMYFIFCIGSMQDKIKIQYAMRYALVWNVRIRIYDFNDGTWSNWH